MAVEPAFPSFPTINTGVRYFAGRFAERTEAFAVVNERTVGNLRGEPLPFVSHAKFCPVRELDTVCDERPAEHMIRRWRSASGFRKLQNSTQHVIMGYVFAVPHRGERLEHIEVDFNLHDCLPLL